LQAIGADITINQGIIDMQIKKIVSLSIVLFFCFFVALSGKAESPPSIQTLIASADALFDGGNVQKAFDLYSQAFRVEPDSVEVNFKLGLAAAALKDFETAVMAFERVLFVDPDFLQAKIEMAKAFYHLGSVETARQYFSEVLAADIPAEVRKSVTSFLAEMN
jgi:tetratricopeptide (TPR) repeat protein